MAVKNDFTITYNTSASKDSFGNQGFGQYDRYKAGWNYNNRAVPASTIIYFRPLLEHSDFEGSNCYVKVVMVDTNFGNYNNAGSLLKANGTVQANVGASTTNLTRTYFDTVPAGELFMDGSISDPSSKDFGYELLMSYQMSVGNVDTGNNTKYKRQPYPHSVGCGDAFELVNLGINTGKPSLATSPLKFPNETAFKTGNFIQPGYHYMGHAQNNNGTNYALSSDVIMMKSGYTGEANSPMDPSSGQYSYTRSEFVYNHSTKTGTSYIFNCKKLFEKPFYFCLRNARSAQWDYSDTTSSPGVTGKMRSTLQLLNMTSSSRKCDINMDVDEIIVHRNTGISSTYYPKISHQGSYKYVVSIVVKDEAVAGARHADNGVAPPSDSGSNPFVLYLKANGGTERSTTTVTTSASGLTGYTKYTGTISMSAAVKTVDSISLGINSYRTGDESTYTTRLLKVATITPKTSTDLMPTNNEDLIVGFASETYKPRVIRTETVEFESGTNTASQQCVFYSKATEFNKQKTKLGSKYIHAILTFTKNDGSGTIPKKVTNLYTSKIADGAYYRFNVGLSTSTFNLLDIKLSQINIFSSAAPSADSAPSSDPIRYSLAILDVNNDQSNAVINEVHRTVTYYQKKIMGTSMADWYKRITAINSRYGVATSSIGDLTGTSALASQINTLRDYIKNSKKNLFALSNSESGTISWDDRMITPAVTKGDPFSVLTPDRLEGDIGQIENICQPHNISNRVGNNATNFAGFYVEETTTYGTNKSGNFSSHYGSNLKPIHTKGANKVQNFSGHDGFVAGLTTLGGNCVGNNAVYFTSVKNVHFSGNSVKCSTNYGDGGSSSPTESKSANNEPHNAANDVANIAAYTVVHTIFKADGIDYSIVPFSETQG